MLNILQISKKLTPIILLSHMRANTSLFGHILGSNPEINGYYEMHIGYYSWKSFIRQKLKYLEHHKFKPNSTYIFDKILHNEHYINCELLNNNAKTIFSLREPSETIPSIIRLFKKVNPSHEFASQSGAIDYYKERLIQLEQYSELLKNNYIYLDANSLKNNTSATFNFIEKNLNLKSPLSREYKIQEMTGRLKSGDNSDYLKQGVLIEQTKKKQSMINTEDSELVELHNLYLTVKAKIIQNSQDYLL